EQLEGTSGSFQPRDQPEEEQPPAKPTPSSPRRSPGSVQGAAGAKPRAEVRPPGSLGIPAGRGALLRQEAIAPQEDGGILESPEKALEKGSSQAEGVPGRSWSGAGSAAGGQGELRPGGMRGDSSSKPGICPGEQREGRASGKGGSEGDSQLSPGTEKPPELPKAAPEQAEVGRAEVCPWESREQGRGVRAEICPWDAEGAPPQQEGQRSPKPGEGVGQPGMGLPGKPPALPKPSSQRAGTMESKKANICPWEAEDKPRPKTEICPWEEAAAPLGKERLRQDTHGTSKGEEKVGSRALEKGKQPPAKSLPKAPSGKSQSSE
ncbi:GP179 protein, partial [Callaeas wilsoni]|nr:GP179 protein [Callaeas wilsoni]